MPNLLGHGYYIFLYYSMDDKTQLKFKFTEINEIASLIKILTEELSFYRDFDVKGKEIYVRKE